MDIFPFGLVGGAIGLLVFIFVLSKCFFTIHTKQAAVIEKFGKFERIGAEVACRPTWRIQFR